MLKLKVTKFLVKLTQENIVVYKLFLSLNISDFSLFLIQKLHPQQKGAGEEYIQEHWNYVLIDSRQEDHNKILIFHILFSKVSKDSKVLGLNCTDRLGWAI